MSDAKHAREDALIRKAERLTHWARYVPWDLIGYGLTVGLWCIALWSWTR